MLLEDHICFILHGPELLRGLVHVLERQLAVGVQFESLLEDLCGLLVVS